MAKFKFIIPDDYCPCNKEVEKYIHIWKGQKGYDIQEKALEKLFERVCPGNDNIKDVFLKCTVLNALYSTNIINVYELAENICKIKDLDFRMYMGDPSVIEDIASCGKRHNYSFATKYCSHHFPKKYAIYDSYVALILEFFRDRDKNERFSFKNDDLREYSKFIDAIERFKEIYHISDVYNLKEIDQYLWQLGKKYFSQYKTRPTDETNEYVAKHHIAFDGKTEEEKEWILRDIREQIALYKYKILVERGNVLLQNIREEMESCNEAREKLGEIEYSRLEGILHSINQTTYDIPIKEDEVCYALALAEESDLIMCVEPDAEYTCKWAVRQCDGWEFHPVLMTREEFNAKSLMYNN